MMNAAYFEKIYEKYSPMLFGVALEICPSKKHAEELLMITFKKYIGKILAGKNILLIV